MTNHFELRTRLYMDWDRRLEHQTKFYGAAALTNAVLAELAVRSHVCVSRTSLELLDRVGRSLEAANIELAHRIRPGASISADFDRTLVDYEQTIVENLLKHWQRTHGARFEQSTAELDRLLFCGSLIRYIPRRPYYMHLYAGVLRRVIDDLGRTIRFAGHEDRVRIGERVTDHLRSSTPACVLEELLFPMIQSIRHS